MTTSLQVRDPQQYLLGVLLGTAVGDALGLPAEGMSRERIQRRWKGEWRMRLAFGRGMISDDTEHTLMVAQALLEHPNNVAAFQRCLAWKLRFWLLGLPAEIGLATLKAVCRLWIGYSPGRSGVWSAGNGPAMRSAIIGAYFQNDPISRAAFISAATRLTHTDPKAETAAQAVAETAAWAVNNTGQNADLIKHLAAVGHDEAWFVICRQFASSLASSHSVLEFADQLGLQKGVTGYAYHSVPVALFAFLSHRDDMKVAMEGVLNCGGDTDTAGAIVGALCGATGGLESVPEHWVTHLVEWPRSTKFIRSVAQKLAAQKKAGRALGSVRYFWPGLVIRNIVFFVVVLLHGLRRLLPPY